MSYSIEDEHDRMDKTLDRIRCLLSNVGLHTSEDQDEADLVEELLHAYWRVCSRAVQTFVEAKQ